MTESGVNKFHSRSVHRCGKFNSIELVHSTRFVTGPNDSATPLELDGEYANFSFESELTLKRCRGLVVLWGLWGRGDLAWQIRELGKTENRATLRCQHELRKLRHGLR